MAGAVYTGWEGSGAAKSPGVWHEVYHSFTTSQQPPRMSSYRRPRIAGATIFFTVNLADRRSDILVRHVDFLRTAIRQTKAERPFRIDAFVVLPDHLHCVWTLPPGDCDYSLRWRLIKARFSRVLPKGATRSSHDRRGERGLWQRRFWEHHIRDRRDFDAHVGYCWNNPVKHGYVENPEDWPLSSIHRNAAP